MIQRIQSLYLLLTTLVSLLFLNGSFFSLINKSGAVFNFNFTGIYMNSGEQVSALINSHLVLTALIILIPLVSLFAIFLFRNRKVQINSVKGLIGLELVLIVTLAYHVYKIISVYDALITFGLKMAIAPIILILSILAYRGIRKDDDLVHSYDRLR